MRLACPSPLPIWCLELPCTTHPPAVQNGGSVFDFRLGGIRGAEAGGSAPVSKECGKNQPLRALVFRSRAIGETDSPASLRSLVTRESHMPPTHA